MSNSNQSYFLPKTRSSKEELESQIRIFRKNSLLNNLFDAVPDLIMIINNNREAVFVNRNFLTYLNIENNSAVLGKRPGELVNCVHAKEFHGCGTTDFCRVCGAATAIHYSLQGKEKCEECRIITAETGCPLDLRVWTTPFVAENGNFTIFSATDISFEKKKASLERIFFHDILNTAGAIQGFAEMLEDATPFEIIEYKEIIMKAVEKLIEEIHSQKDLDKAEKGELCVKQIKLDSLDVLKDISIIYRTHFEAKGKFIKIENNAINTVFYTDKVLLKRILGNIVKNALEASDRGETVTLSTDHDKNNVFFYIHNNYFIPQDIQLQLFHRSFSTKCKGRGMGTYSMKLLGEKYLNGKISFNSTLDRGTVFTAAFPIKPEENIITENIKLPC